MRKLRRLLRTIVVFSTFTTFLRLFYGLIRCPSALLRTRSGLIIRVRNNRWDARILSEIFLDRCYLRLFDALPPSPVVVDVGGYLGDFTLQAAHGLGARVVVYEPTPENFRLLKENVALNGLEERITCHNAGISDHDGTIVLNVSRADGALHVSRYLYDENPPERLEVPVVTVSRIMTENTLSHIDLLKIDCEGCEYDILTSLEPDLLARIDRLVFEYHRVPDFRSKLDAVTARLTASGFRIREDHAHSLIAAARVATT